MSARSLAHALFRHRRIFVVVMLAALAAGAAVVAARPPAYRAEAILMADSSRPGGARALAALFESADLHRAVVSELGPRLYPLLPPEEHATAFAAALAVEPADGSSLVRIAFDGHRPALAAQALSALMSGVTARNRAVFQVAGVPEPQGMDAESERAALMQRRAAIERDRVGAEAEAVAQSDTLAMLTARLAATPRTIELSAQSQRSRVVDEARAKLFELETKEQELLGKYTPESIFVGRVRDERRKVERLLADLMATNDTRVTQGANEVHQALEKEVFRAEAAATSARSRAKALAARLNEIDARLKALAGRGGRGAAVDGIGVVQEAAALARPVGPGPLATIAIAAGIGLALALALVALAQRLSTRFATPAEVERRLGLPVLTTIPRES